MPRITAALDVMEKAAGLSSNEAVCDKAAGMVLGKLRELGLDARIADAKGHTTVRVRTADGDVIVDPTMSQFYRDGSSTDSLLRKQGGYVGTKKQLRAFLSWPPARRRISALPASCSCATYAESARGDAGQRLLVSMPGRRAPKGNLDARKGLQ